MDLLIIFRSISFNSRLSLISDNCPINVSDELFFMEFNMLLEALLKPSILTKLHILLSKYFLNSSFLISSNIDQSPRLIEV